LQHDIVVIGGSAGSLEPLRVILGSLPEDFPGSVFVVIHLSPEFPSMLDEVVTRWGGLRASFPPDCEAILPGRIYLAPPDRHLLIEPGRVRIECGPRENRHRPAIDPLFRTAARVYGPRVVGIILSGMRDDGSAGLYAIKQRGGVTMVQDPDDAVWSEMPRGAIRYVRPDFILPSLGIPHKIVDLAVDHDDFSTSGKASGTSNGPNTPPDKPDVNLESSYPEEGEGKPSVFACPECHGVLWELKDEGLVRFRCRVGHSYGAEALHDELTEASESALWAAVRALEEKAALERRAVDRLPNDATSAKRLREQSTADDASARIIRELIFGRHVEVDRSEAETVPAKKKIA